MRPKSMRSLLKKVSQLVVIMAHADDETIHAGGLLLYSIDKSLTSNVLIVTDGRLGLSKAYSNSTELVATRKKELEQVLRIVGAKSISFPQFIDGSLNNQVPLLKSAFRKLFSELPENSLIITHDPSGYSNHPDHIATSLSVYQAWLEDFSESHQLMFAVKSPLQKEVLSALHPQRSFVNMPRPTHQIVVNKILGRKLQLAHIYKSQNLIKLQQFSHNILSSLVFSTEYFHSVDKKQPYRFQYYPFASRYFRYNPNLDEN